MKCHLKIKRMDSSIILIENLLIVKRCVVRFDPYAKSFLKSLFSKNTSPSDTVKGEVYHNDKIVGVVEGSWLGVLDFTDEKTKQKTRLWNIITSKKLNVTPTENPLPSDSRFRQDLVYLKKKDLDESAKWKLILEQKQRKEAAWRKEGIKN